VENLIIIGVAGFVGANVRYLVSLWAAQQFGQSFPWGTLLINLTGSCLLGVFLGWSGNHLTADPRLRLFIAVGFFGAYTTFSTYATDSMRMLGSGDWLGAVGNILGTNFLCLVGAVTGLALGGRL
jgi:CrcB protein